MKTETTLRSIPRHEPAKRSPEREKLAAAIAAAAEAERSLDAARRSVTRAGDAVRRAEDRLAETRTAVGDARLRHVALLSEAARAGAPATGPSSVRNARQDERDAAEEVELAQAAETELKARLPDLVDATTRARHRLVNAVDSVIRAETVRLVEECKAAEAVFLAKRSVLHFLERPHVSATDGLHGIVPSPFGESSYDHEAHGERNRAFEGAKAVIDDVLHRPLFAGEANWNRHEAVRPWIAARQALFTDPDAPLA